MLLRPWLVVVRHEYRPPFVYGPYWTKKSATKIKEKARRRYAKYIQTRVFVVCMWKF